MPTALAQAGVPDPDDLDRILDEQEFGDFLRDLTPPPNRGLNAAAETKDEDQEVQVKKQRRPVPKLDEQLLLSDSGIPRLRRITKSKVKFRGKGHEFSDISRLLNTYQLWLDDLYPRAKFRDALTMVEKLGHSKRMQLERRAWLDATKPGRRELTPADDDLGLEALPQNERDDHVAEQDVPVGTALEIGTSERGRPDAAGVSDASANSGTIPASTTVPSRPSGPFQDDDEPDMDELDELLAQDPTASTSGRAARDADDEESDGPVTQTDRNGKATSMSKPQQNAGQFDDDEEAMADFDAPW